MQARLSTYMLNVHSTQGYSIFYSFNNHVAVYYWTLRMCGESNNSFTISTYSFINILLTNTNYNKINDAQSDLFVLETGSDTELLCVASSYLNALS